MGWQGVELWHRWMITKGSGPGSKMEDGIWDMELHGRMGWHPWPRSAGLCVLAALGQRRSGSEAALR